jgi:hypothetical protein
MKTQEEIQAAHDKLIAFMNGKIPFKMSKDAPDPRAVAYACKALCWVLADDHPEAQHLDALLEFIDGWAARNALKKGDSFAA